MRVTSSSRVRPSAANVVAAPEIKNAPAPTSIANQRNRGTSAGRNGILSARRERSATIAPSGGNANHSLQVVNTKASEWPARTKSEVPDHNTIAMTTALRALSRSCFPARGPTHSTRRTASSATCSPE